MAAPGGQPDMTDQRASRDAGCVTWERRGACGVITIAHPPVNALGAEVRTGLAAALDAACGADGLQAVVIVGAGRNFSAGADIGEFGKPPAGPRLVDVCARVEALSVPVIAAVHGVAYGGGLELALAAHYRIADRSARFAFPEVNLGLLPGAGGTQRAPRLVGIPAALDLMLRGKPISVDAALRVGLIDEVAGAGAVLDAALVYARELIAQRAGPRRVSERAAEDDVAAERALGKARAELASRYRGLYSPARIVDAVALSRGAAFDAGVAFERDAFRECMQSPQRGALVHAFFAERRTARVPEAAGGAAQDVAQVGIVGGGTMGTRIAVAVLDAGLSVVLAERDAENLARAAAGVAGIYDRQVDTGRIMPAARAERLARFRGTVELGELADADLVVEAVFEDLAVKGDVFAALDGVLKPSAILASNTSYLDVGRLAARTTRPAKVIGLHFFSPANVMKLVEVVVTDGTSPDTVATCLALARRLGKIPVRARVCDGFIGNRILAAYREAAMYMLEDGASPYQVDRVVRAFGFPMGPFEMTDLAGGQISWSTRKRQAATRDPRLRYVPIADGLCERGWFGRRAGRGWYRYDAGEHAPREDPEVLALVDADRERAGVTPRAFTDDEVERRYLAAMINESARVLEEGVAARSSDVDVVLLRGYGFPRYRGGPLYCADQRGARRVLDDVRAFGAAGDPWFWRPSPLLERMAADDGRFSDWNDA